MDYVTKELKSKQREVLGKSVETCKYRVWLTAKGAKSCKIIEYSLQPFLLS